MKRVMTVRTVCGIVATLLAIASGLSSTWAQEKKSTVENALGYTMNSLGGEKVDLKKYKGKVVLLVNTASACGLTPQYTELQAVYEKYKDKGLVVLGFPCNQFGKQEPGSATEISEFCTKNYGVTFDMFEKVEVNGEGACELYKSLTAMDLKPKGSGKVSWNFEKFLLDRDGKPVARFEPKTSPDDKEIIAAVENLLGSK